MLLVRVVFARQREGDVFDETGRAEFSLTAGARARKIGMRKFLEKMGFTREGLKRALRILFLTTVITIALW